MVLPTAQARAAAAGKHWGTGDVAEHAGKGRYQLTTADYDKFFHANVPNWQGIEKETFVPWRDGSRSMNYLDNRQLETGSRNGLMPGRGGPGGTLTPRMPTSLTDRPDGMIPQVAPRMPGPSLQTRSVGEDQDIPGVSGRLRGLLSRTSPYIQRARTRALQDANRRGLMSSSIAQTAGEAAAIDAALPIAQADAGIAASERAMAHEARQAEMQRQFAGRQAELDRETQRLMQDRGLSFEAAQAEASRAQNQQRALQSGIQMAQEQYQTSLDRLTANLDLPVEERQRMEEHYSYVYDEALRGLQALYGVDISWTPRQRPTEAGV